MNTFLFPPVFYVDVALLVDLSDFILMPRILVLYTKHFKEPDGSITIRIRYSSVIRFSFSQPIDSLFSYVTTAVDKHCQQVSE